MLTFKPACSSTSVSALPFSVGGVLGIDRPGHVALAALDLQRAHRRLGHRLEDDALQLRLVAPVAVERLDGDVVVLLPLDELERPGADRRSR